jgi:hypothetical protein
MKNRSGFDVVEPSCHQAGNEADVYDVLERPWQQHLRIRRRREELNQQAMNAQLQKHLLLYNGEGEDRSREAPGWWRKDLLASWTERLDERLSQLQESYYISIPKSNQVLSTRLLCGGFVALLALFCMLNDWNLLWNNDEWTRGIIVTILLLGSMCLLAAVHHAISARRERQRLVYAQALRKRVYLQISELLGSIGAPCINMINSEILGKRLLLGDYSNERPLDWCKTCVEEDINTFVRFVQAQSESLQTISYAIQTIETTTRFFYGGTTMASRRSTHVLPTLRHRVHALLRAKLQHLEHLRKALTVSQEESVNNEEYVNTNPVEEEVVTISRLRDMKKEAAQLLSETCDLVLSTSAASCLSHQRSLLEQLGLECDGVSAFLKQAMNASSLSGHTAESGHEQDQAVVSLVDMASSLHFALVSLHQQQQTASNDMDANSKARFHQLWQATSRQSRLLSEHIDDLVASANTTEQEDGIGQEGDKSEGILSKGVPPSSVECDDKNVASIDTTFLPHVDSVVVETLVYSDVADPPKPRRRSPRQDQSERARKCRPSPFELVEELQIRLQMMTVPEERPVR